MTVSTLTYAFLHLLSPAAIFTNIFYISSVQPDTIMTSLSKPNYPVEIGHSPEEEGAFDEEKINFSPSSSLRQLQDDSICFSSSNSVEGKGKEDGTAGDEEGDDNAENNKKKKTGTGKLVCAILAGIAALTTAVAAGVSVNSNRRAQTQISTSLLAGQSKSAKVAPYCDRLTCGQVFTGEKVTLTEDLFCDIPWSSATEKNSRNCAITLEDDAELDCNGFTVSQIFSDTSKNIEDLLNCPDGGELGLGRPQDKRTRPRRRIVVK